MQVKDELLEQNIIIKRIADTIEPYLSGQYGRSDALGIALDVVLDMLNEFKLIELCNQAALT